MELRLSIYPIIGKANDQSNYALKRYNGFDVLNFENNWNLFRQIRNLREFGDDIRGEIKVTPLPLPKNVEFSVLDEDKKGWRRIKTDGYGEPLTYLLAKEFKKLLLDKNTPVINKAIMKFLHALPAKTMVILYWA